MCHQAHLLMSACALDYMDCLHMGFRQQHLVHCQRQDLTTNTVDPRC